MFKGEINKGGRPKGSNNKVTAEMKNLISELLSENVIEVRTRLRNLDDATFVKTYIQLMKFIVPQQRAVTFQDTSETIPHFQIEVLDGNGETLNIYEDPRQANYN